MKSDHLDQETSLSADITPTGVNAKAKSRAIAAFVRRVGHIIEVVNAPLEAKNAERRAISHSHAEIIQALGKATADRIVSDSAFAEEVIRAQLKSIATKLENKKSVLAIAFDDLQINPPSEEQSISGKESLDEEFLCRFERYAEDASDEQLRIKWGKILSSEIKSPGSISRKAMRILDEMDNETAILFESICKSRIDDTIPKCLSGEIRFDTLARLVAAEVIIDPGLTGQISLFAETVDDQGTELWIKHHTHASVAYEKTVTFTAQGNRNIAPLIGHERGPAAPVYILTESGKKIASIFDDNLEQAWSGFLDAISKYITPNEIREYKKNDNNTLKITKRLKQAEQAP